MLQGIWHWKDLPKENVVLLSWGLVAQASMVICRVLINKVPSIVPRLYLAIIRRRGFGGIFSAPSSISGKLIGMDYENDYAKTALPLLSEINVLPSNSTS